MEGCLAKTLSWMPEVEKFCFRSKLVVGAKNAIFSYMILSVAAVIKTVFTFAYHLDGEHFIVFPQILFLFLAALTGFITFYLAIPLGIKILRKKDIPESTLSLLFILFCLIFGICDVIWSFLTLIRAFLDPGMCILSNQSRNPYEKKTERRKRGKWGKIKSIEFGESDKERERKAKYEQWEKDHENDTVVVVKNEWCDAIVAALFIIIQIFGFYLLVCLKSYLSESDDEGD